jgi:S-adenosyl-L-methionine hydrolase (adenosine-forming)
VKARRGERETGRRGVKTFPRPVSASPRLPVSRSPPLITLLTDFGMSDYFVGAMKGVILSINPQAKIVDITHDIPPQDICAAAFTLVSVFGSFPPRTVHVAVVDPGVGSTRRPILMAARSQFFVGPDNGIFSYIFDRDSDARVFHLTNERYFRDPVSRTFHGRDVFAPVAAAVARGVKPEKLGERVNDQIRLPALAAEHSGEGKLTGRILHIDHFGNCITNFTQQDLATESLERGVRLTVNRKVVNTFRCFFSDGGDKGEQLFAIWGSAGFLEIAAMNQSAAELLKVKCGETVVLAVLK